MAYPPGMATHEVANQPPLWSTGVGAGFLHSERARFDAMVALPEIEVVPRGAVTRVR